MKIPYSAFAVLALAFLCCACPSQDKSSLSQISISLWSVQPPDSLIIRGQALDLRGLIAFRVVQAGPEETIGLVTTLYNGYLLKFDGRGELLASRRTQPIRDFRIPDPARATGSQQQIFNRNLETIFLLEGSPSNAGIASLEWHLYRLLSAKLEDIWAADALVSLTDPRTGESHFTLATISPETWPSPEAWKFFYIARDMNLGSSQVQECLVPAQGRVVCARSATPTTGSTE